jgi:hypothetical protein
VKTPPKRVTFEESERQGDRIITSSGSVTEVEHDVYMCITLPCEKTSHYHPFQPKKLEGALKRLAEKKDKDLVKIRKFRFEICDTPLSCNGPHFHVGENTTLPPVEKDVVTSDQLCRLTSPPSVTAQDEEQRSTQTQLAPDVGDDLEFPPLTSSITPYIQPEVNVLWANAAKNYLKEFYLEEGMQSAADEISDDDMYNEPAHTVEVEMHSPRREDNQLPSLTPVFYSDGELAVLPVFFKSENKATLWNTIRSRGITHCIGHMAVRATISAAQMLPFYNLIINEELFEEAAIGFDHLMAHGPATKANSRLFNWLLSSREKEERVNILELAGYKGYTTATISTTLASELYIRLTGASVADTAIEGTLLSRLQSLAQVILKEKTFPNSGMVSNPIAFYTCIHVYNIICYQDALKRYAINAKALGVPNFRL